MSFEPSDGLVAEARERLQIDPYDEDAQRVLADTLIVTTSTEAQRTVARGALADAEDARQLADGGAHEPRRSVA